MTRSPYVPGLPAHETGHWFILRPAQIIYVNHIVYERSSFKKKYRAKVRAFTMSRAKSYLLINFVNRNKSFLLTLSRNRKKHSSLNRSLGLPAKEKRYLGPYILKLVEAYRNQISHNYQSRSWVIGRSWVRLLFQLNA